jgi:phosphoglycerate dehydrogenase-like enzyme
LDIAAFHPSAGLPGFCGGRRIILMFQAALLLSPEALSSAYGGAVLDRLRPQLGRLTLVAPGGSWRQYSEQLRSVEVIFSGWGAPLMDEEFLNAAPNLKVIFYAGGSVRYFTTPALWRRGVRLATAQTINAVPVSEYVLAAVLLGLKRVWHYARMTRETCAFPAERPMPGAYGSVIGLVSYGTIARLVRQKLRGFDLKIMVYDPFLAPEDAVAEQVSKVGLDELFATADVVSVHTPALPETTRLIGKQQLALMKSGALFINTARGEVVDEPAMVEVLQGRSDLQAILDVTAPEPPETGSPLYTLPNVVLTPHIAGSVGAECQRMGLAMVEEFERYRAGLPLLWEINSERAARIA